MRRETGSTIFNNGDDDGNEEISAAFYNLKIVTKMLISARARLRREILKGMK